MRKKILKILGIFLFIFIINNIVDAANINNIKRKGYNDLINVEFQEFNSGTLNIDSGDGYTIDPGVICVHDSSYDGSGYYQELDGVYYASRYYYYDRIWLNPYGSEPTKMYYESTKSANNTNTDTYGKDISFLSRFFYEGKEYSYALYHEYRTFCTSYMSEGFKNWFKKGSFVYFIHAQKWKETYYRSYDSNGVGHYDDNSLMFYKKSEAYSNFMVNLADENKKTIGNKGYTTVSSAVAGKEKLETNTDINWEITVNSPYYAYEENIYDGVTFKYAFVNSDAASSVNWDTASVASASLVSGSGYGYKNVKLSGLANTDKNANILVIQCSYPTYTGLAMGFATYSGQERYLVSGKKNTYSSYIAYDIEKSPNVTITKKVYTVNGESVSDEIPKVQIGDTVVYEIEITNNGSYVTTATTLTDTFDSQLLIKDAASYGWSKSGTSYSQTISSIGSSSIKKYIKFEVGGYTTDASGNKSISNISRGEVLKNTATLSGLPESNPNGTVVTDDASVRVQGYNTTISKVVNKIYKSDNATETGSQTQVEPGDIVQYKITLTNNSECVINNITIEDIIPSGMTYHSRSSTWEKSGNIYTYAGNVGKDGHIELYIKAKVNDNAHINYETLTNTATTKKYQNRKDVYILEEESSQVTLNVLDYNYEITKEIVSITSGGVERTNNLGYAEKGDIIKYEIKLTNNNDTILYQVNIKDTLPEGLVVYDYEEPYNEGEYWVWNAPKGGSIANVSMGRDTVYREKGTKTFYIEALVTKDISTEDVILTNTVETTQVKNRNGVILSNVSDTENIEILGYNYEIRKYIWKVYKSDGKTEAGKLSTQAEPGDIVQYRIGIENNGSTSLHNISIEDVLPEGMTYVKNSDAWTKAGNTYTYSDSIPAGRTVSLYITARVTAPVANTSVELINTATLTQIKNKNDVDLITGMKDDVSIIVLGYNVNLNKYIDVDNRKEWTNEAKNDSPVVVQKGNEVKYSIVLQNTGITTLYNPQIIDNLPDGLQHKSNSDDWTKNENVYTYKGILEPNKMVTLDITCKVTKSNMYLFNIENTATYGIVNNRNDIDTSSVLVLGNNKEYIRLDELDISGTVWEDTDADGALEGGESKISGIEVKLHSLDKDSDGTYKDNVVTTTTTDNNGKYTFNNVQKGLIKDANGNYQNTAGQGYKKYYIQFVYNGVTYESTKYADMANIENDGSIKEAYKTDSNAAERTDLREAFNKSLETISYNLATGDDGTTKELSYTKNGTTSTLDLTPNITISAFSFVDTKNGYPTMDRLLWLNGDYTGNMSSYKVKENTDYLGYINLGLIRRESVDLELQNGMESFTETINGQELEYVRGNIQEAYTSHLYDQDYTYKYTDYADEAIRNMKTELSELNIEVKYRTVITNKSRTLNTVVNELTQYYNENFKSVYKEDGKTLYTQEMKIDSNNDGIFDDENKLFTFTVKYEHLNGETIKATGTADAKLIPEYEDLEGKDVSGHKTIYITGIDDIVLQPGESIVIYTEYIVDKDSARNLKLNNKLDVISEINAYSTYTDTNKNIPAGAIDIDSNPGNLGETNEKGTFTTITDKTYYEDDTSNTGITFKYPTDDSESPYERQITGVVWEDFAKETIDGQKTGNGILEDTEDKVKDIKVELYEIVKVGSDYKEILASSEEVRTDDNGNYTIKGYKPGMYIIRFTYGDKEENIYYNGQDYKSTIYKINSENSEDTNDNIKELTQEIHYSDARDDEQRRLEVMNYSIEMYNEIAEKLKGEFSSNKVELIKNTKTFADTPTFMARLENVENDVNKIKYFKTDGSSMWYKNGDESNIYVRRYSINNIDFGLVQRPNTKVELEKYISEIKLETSAGDLLVDVKYDENGVLQDGSIGTENLQAINNTKTQQGFRYINVDEELLQGATITINYGFNVMNNSEIDYISEKLYGDAATTKDIKDKIGVAIGESEDLNKEFKYKDSSQYYGHYLGGIYYKGAKTDDVVATIKIDTILDYVDNSLVFNVIDNDGKWTTTTADELKGKFIKEEVYTELYDKVGSSIGKFLVDKYEIQYQTENKNNLAVTVDDDTLNPMLSKQLYPKEYVERMTGKTEEEKRNLTTATVDLTVSTVLSSESEEDDMVYENIAEVIKFTTLTGRRTVSDQTVGNAKVYKAGYTKDDETLKEADTSITEKIMLTPPTGLSYIQRFSKTIIYILSGIVVIVLGILFIPKLVDKIKNRKFIK